VKLKVVRRGIYRVRERGNSCMRGWVWEENGLNLNGEVTREEWIDVSGEEIMGKRIGFDR